jgi:hypothetical protein
MDAKDEALQLGIKQCHSRVGQPLSGLLKRLQGVSQTAVQHELPGRAVLPKMHTVIGICYQCVQGWVSMPGFPALPIRHLKRGIGCREWMVHSVLKSKC